MALLPPASIAPTGAFTAYAPAATQLLDHDARGLDAGLSPTGASAVERAPLPTLTAHLLGQFHVILNDHMVQDWPSGRGRALFSYLLTHRERPALRDVLMDTFWPDADPEAARNNLNVTLHRLRQALRATDELPIVIFEDGTYRLNPDLHVWLDVDEFERHAQAGRRAEAAGQIAAAAAEYELAIGLYQGDFLEDDPYDDWPVLLRERLRVAYLDTLDCLSQLYFGQGQLATCIMVCQRLLARDSCREDAHCRLMRCYSRQGQRYLALRQYQVCAQALRAELDVEPDAATAQLYERIRRHEQV
jgi:DNA-binding SARP family transcriptional activator